MKPNKSQIISVDIGGTFCDACYESGQLFRSIKLLSNGRLRASIIEILAPKIIRIKEAWSLPYPLVLKGCSCISVNGLRNRIETYSTNEGILYLESPQKYSVGADIEISGDAEAPVFAAHLLTGIPMYQPLKGIELRIGTTKATNALLELKGTPCVWITNEGFRDLLYIKSQQRPHLFQLNIPEPILLYQRTIETKARINAAGEILNPLDKKELSKIITALPKNKEIPIAISLLHSYKNPVHEVQIKDALNQLGFRFISCSSELLPTIHFLPRSETAVCNAYLSPILHRFISDIQLQAKTDDLYLISSIGQAIPIDQFHPKDSLLSGPAGGIKAAEYLSASYGLKKIITFDMGGTSTDTARIDVKAAVKFKTKIDQSDRYRIEIASPAYDIETVAAGGGSIIDFEDGRFTVGPSSAGADPGPACYGRGGPFTITDLNLLMGRLAVQAISIPLDRNKSQLKFDALLTKARLRSISKNQTSILQGIAQIANEKMAEAVRKISIGQGHDPAHYHLLVYGGAGGLHACAIADLLHMKTILIPYTAGIFSATGMSKANIAQTRVKQINLPLNVNVLKIPKWFDDLAKEKTNSEYFVNERIIHLKYVGQNHIITINWSERLNLVKKFTTIYKRQFGSGLSKAIEVDKLQIVLVKKGRIPHIKKRAFLKSDKTFKSGLVLSWTTLNAGERLDGPKTIFHNQATVFLAENWIATVQNNKDLVLQKKSKRVATHNWSLAIEHELFNNRFKAIAEQMGVQLQHSAFSVNVKERLDFSCAILDAKARLIANAPHIPVHLGSLGVCARLILKKYHLLPGDIILCNHPKYGGSHLPDLTLLQGVFDSKNKLIAYIINRAHHAEIGGLTPGSMPPFAHCLEEEGVVFLPTYIQQNGKLKWPQIEHLLRNARYPTRDLRSNLLDLKAALYSLTVGAKRLQELSALYGLEYVHVQMKNIFKQGAQEVKRFIQQSAQKTFSAIEQMDDGRSIQIKIQIIHKKLVFDFKGTSLPHPGNLNANPAIVWSVILYVLRILCKKDINLNEGLAQKVVIKLPLSFLHPRFMDDPKLCPAVVGGNTEVSQRITDTLIKALGLAACSQGTMNNFLFGNDRYSYYETIGGGTGATQGHPGRSAVHQHMTNTKITDPEELELRYPVLLEHFKIRSGSGGKGQFNGGHGISRQIKFLEPMTVTIIGQHRNVSPYGVSNGAPGSRGKEYKIAGGKAIKIKSNETFQINAGESIRIETPGGGAWGDKIKLVNP